jgi:hypothetical protein
VFTTTQYNADNQEASRRCRRDVYDDENPPPQGYACQRQRRRANFLYRHDSLRGTHVRQMDLYLSFAERLLEEAQLYTIVIVCYTMVSAFYARICLDSSSAQINRVVSIMVFQVSWIISYGHLLILNTCDILYFPIGSRNPEGRFDDIRNNSVDLLEDHDADTFTGFNKAQLKRLFISWRIPDIFVDSEGNGTRFSGEEATIYYLTNLRTGEAYTRMTQKFGGDPRRFTKAIRLVVNHLYTTFYHKISGDSMRQWLPSITKFRHAIWSKLVAGETIETSEGNTNRVRVSVPFPNFVVFGFMDDLGIQTCSPGGDARSFYGCVC